MRSLRRAAPAILPLLMIMLLACSCNSHDNGGNRNTSPDAIYLDYQVWGDAETADITVKLQFRLGGKNGNSLLLTAPSQVEFDGQLLPADSSKMSGVYYEISSPAADFGGKHTIIFTDARQKTYTEEFEFPVLSFRTAISPTVLRNDLLVELDGLAPVDQVQVILTDTSYYSRGLDRLDTVRNGQVFINAGDLESVRNGPVQLEFYRDEQRALRQPTKTGGRLALSYAIKEEFELLD